MSYDALILCETNLSDDILDAELEMTNYQIYRKDRSIATSQKKCGGGVLVAVNKNLFSHAIDMPALALECLFVVIKIGRLTALLCGVYIPPGQPTAVYSSFSDTVIEVLSLHTDLDMFFIMGDFNLPSTLNWNSKQKFDSSSQVIADLAAIFELSQMNDIRNDRGVTLDLVFSSLPTQTEVTKAMDCLLQTDSHHPPLHIESDLPFSRRKPCPSVVFNFRKCNLSEVERWIYSVPYPVDSSNVEDDFNQFCSSLSEVVRLNCPPKTVGASPFPIWFTKELKTLIIRKKIAHKNYKATLSEQLYYEFQFLRHECRTLTRRCYDRYMRFIESTIPENIKVFWSHVNSRRNRPALPDVLRLDQTIATSPIDKCELFSQYFQTIFRSNTNQPIPTSGKANLSMNTFFVSCEEIEETLAKLDPNKGPGPDHIPSSVLRYLSSIVAPHITIFFNSLLKRGIFPSSLKNGYITPIFKSGDASDVRNYRPVVIQPCLAKVFESIVLRRFSHACKQLIVPQQHGFLPGRSTSTNLGVYQSHIIASFQCGHQLDSVYLDFAKAFDRVSHAHLLQKLEDYGVGDGLLEWFRSYLSDRTLSVRFGGAISSSISAQSGVPQGSLLGPALFSFFINDICEDVHVNLLLFADDIKLFCEIASPNDAQLLQASLDGVINWCSRNEMELNIPKCAVITFSRIVSPVIFDYHIANSPLRRTQSIKDLGVVFTSNLSPEEHLHHICKKANKALGFLFRISKDGFSPSTLLTLYAAIVRPHLEYASVIWTPFQLGHKQMLEGVQSRFVRLIGTKLGYRFYDAPLLQLMSDLKITSLESRRLYLDMVFLQQLISGVVDCSELLEMIDFRPPGRTRSQAPFSKRLYNNNYSHHSMLPRLLRMGNHLSLRVDFFGLSSDSFKRQLRKTLND